MMSAELPTIVYKCPGSYQCAGGSYDYKSAGEQEELDSLLGAGWFISLPEAIKGEHELGGDDAPATREELEAKATELGISFDGRTTDAALLRRIGAALEAS